ncbi:hypothetical protein BGX28_006013 [Mortierella sp. GBA30]|nr:hypothetical protein BGX28_006013 [Mortierella sp. GBA30]
MWNPPPPDILINVKRRPDIKKPKAPGVNGITNGYHDLSPRISLNNDPGFPSERSNNPSAANSVHGQDDNIVNSNYNYNHNLESGNTENNSSALPNNPFSSTNRATAPSGLPHPRLEKVGPYLTIATLQAYTVLTVVRCLAAPVWIVIRSGNGPPDGSNPAQVEIGHLEKSFLACAIAFTMLSCVGVTMRILDKMPWLRRIPVITAYLEALTSFLSTHSLPPGGQFSHGFLSCIITAVFSSIVALMLTVDWWRGFPSAGLSATLKALIISSFVMTIVIIIGAAMYSSLEKWSFDDAVNFCIVSFATIGYGNLSPKSVAGRIIFFFYGLLGISSLGFFVVSLRNAVIEQFQWRLVDRFSAPAHLTRVQTRMSAKDISFPAARFEEEQQVKIMVKRKMILRMFVTLTTIGFGDYVPKEPGSVEFWNVYVFVGLAVFAYILSLSSESMASQIHLVDDQDEEDDDDMYGWERNEDPNAPLTTRSAILGLEGLKWLHHQQQQQHQGSDLDLVHLDQEGKPPGNNLNRSATSFEFEGSLGGDVSLQSSIQRSRSKRKSSTGRILMVSAKERKQMLQAEYYASHSLPTTIRFVDTKGMPHQRTIGRGMSTSEAVSGQGGDDQLPTVYGTMGYFGTVGRRDSTGVRRIGTNQRDSLAFRGVGLARHGTMYGAGSSPLNTVRTHQLQHQPLIRFDSPQGSIRTTGGHHHSRPSPRSRQDTDQGDDRETRPGYIPSCMDLFRQNKEQDNFGEGSSTQAGNHLAVEGSPMARVRSNSWDQSERQHRSPPSQNEIHRWLAEDAGTLKGPNFMYGGRASQQQEGFDICSSADRPRPSQSSDVTRVTSPPLDLSTLPTGSAHSKSETIASDGSRLGPVQYNREGVAPDEMLIECTEEPEQMSAIEEQQFQAGRDIQQANEERLALSSPEPRPPEFMSIVREPTLTENGSTSITHLLFDPDTSPLSQLSEDHDHQHTFRPSISRPMSLFSNHPRSGHNSAMQSPASSRPSSRAPSVLMTIFDEPVMNVASRPASRSPSISGGSRVESMDNLVSRAQPSSQMTGLGITEGVREIGGEGADHDGDRAAGTRRRINPSSSDISIGPFDEVRNPESIPHFDDDVDLNRAELHPQQIEEMRRRREDLRRREREIEAKLSSSSEKNRS